MLPLGEGSEHFRDEAVRGALARTRIRSRDSAAVGKTDPGGTNPSLDYISKSLSARGTGSAASSVYYLYTAVSLWLFLYYQTLVIYGLFFLLQSCLTLKPMDQLITACAIITQKSNTHCELGRFSLLQRAYGSV